MKKQFIWIMTDTMGYNMVGCYGSEISTPNVDGMARRGLRFERAYTCQPVCGPARSALFTGQYPHTNGSWGNSMPLGADVKTLGQRLTAAGVPCAYIGKWHLDAGDYFGNGVCPDGWDPAYWYDMKCYLDELTEEERLFSRDPASSKKGVEAPFTYGYRVTVRALEYIEAHKDEDFFLVVSYDEPHGPCLCPEPYASMYDRPLGANPAWDDGLSDKPECLRVWAETTGQADPAKRCRGIAPELAACTSYIDSQIGRVLDCARENTPDALRLFTSDHGDAAHAHGLNGKGPSVCDEIARIPLIFEGPCAPVGAVYGHVVSHIDLPATVLDYMGLQRPVMLEGESLLPQLRDPSAPTNRPAHVEFGRYEIDHDGFGGFQPMRAVVTDEYKLALHLLDGDEMYDTARDPHDLRNVIDDGAYAEIRDRLHDEIIDWMNRTRDPFRGYQWQCRPWRGDKTPSWNVDGYTRQRDNDPGEYRQLDYDTGLPMEKATRHKNLSGK
ncbi:MAG: sulfatase-like hydrolase/transferase [Clostridia bacterium]|nr:sulfatase-like hydrolase/transferase [Clostridia bacterium]